MGYIPESLTRGPSAVPGSCDLGEAWGCHSITVWDLPDS